MSYRNRPTPPTPEGSAHLQRPRQGSAGNGTQSNNYTPTTNANRTFTTAAPSAPSLHPGQLPTFTPPRPQFLETPSSSNSSNNSSNNNSPGVSAGRGIDYRPLPTSSTNTPAMQRTAFNLPINSSNNNNNSNNNALGYSPGNGGPKMYTPSNNNNHSTNAIFGQTGPGVQMTPLGRQLPIQPTEDQNMMRQRLGQQQQQQQQQPQMQQLQPSPMVAINVSNAPSSYPFPGYAGIPPQQVHPSPMPMPAFQTPLPRIGISPTLHFGPAPVRQSRRYKTTKKVTLTDGNLVMDCPVPSELLDGSPISDGDEFRTMRYTAVTSDPDDFVHENYTLRPKMFGRQTELFIVMTMYNEDEILFTRTMHGVVKNVALLCARNRSKTWGAEGWKKIVVCIVADGRYKCNPRVLSVLASMGVYQDGIAKNTVGGREVQAHLYEYTTQISIDSDLKVQRATRDSGIPPVQVLFCLKEQNKKKLNSHRWFFNAFGPIIDPNVCVLLDVGTKPKSNAIYHLWKAFSVNKNLGGACGEIKAQLGPGCVNLINPLVAAQNFEYKMSNILDKPMESVFGYISVLPGAFSAYRYKALLNDTKGNGPLASYFKGERPSADSGIFEANMYLAEDRVLCFELVAKRGGQWLLKYVRAAVGETDVPQSVPEFISQRRRWLNGSFFAAVYALTHSLSIWRSDHNFLRKMLFHLEFFYNFISIVFSWFAIANMYLTFYFLAKALADPLLDPFGNGWGSKVFEIMRYLYYFLLCAQFICSMGNRPQGSQATYTISMLAFAGIMGYMLFAAALISARSIQAAIIQLNQAGGSSIKVLEMIIQNSAFRDIVLSLISTYGLYIIMSLLYLDAWHMGTSIVQYLFLMPSYVNILNVYAFCNTHDVSWGTKGDNTTHSDLGDAKKSDGQQVVEVEVPTDIADINAAYREAIDELKHKAPEIHQSRSAETKKDDYYRAFRTRLVLVWIGTNGLLVTGVSSMEKQLVLQNGSNAYLAGVMWSVFLLSAVRGIGSTLYLLRSCISH